MSDFSLCIRATSPGSVFEQVEAPTFAESGGEDVSEIIADSPADGSAESPVVSEAASTVETQEFDVEIAEAEEAARLRRST